LSLSKIKSERTDDVIRRELGSVADSIPRQRINETCYLNVDPSTPAIGEIMHCLHHRLDALR